MLNNSQIFKYNKEMLCFCCNTLQDHKEDIQIFKINNRGYSSIFAGDEMEIHYVLNVQKSKTGMV